MEEEGAVTWPRKLRAHWRLPSLPNNIHSPNNNPRRRARTFIGLFASSIRYIVRLLTGNLFKRLNKSKTKVKKKRQLSALLHNQSSDLSVHLSMVYLSICLPIYLPTYLSVYLSIGLSVYLSIGLSVYRSICLLVYLFIHLVNQYGCNLTWVIITHVYAGMCTETDTQSNTHALFLNHTRTHARAHTHLQKQVIMTPCSLFWREFVSRSALRI